MKFALIFLTLFMNNANLSANDCVAMNVKFDDNRIFAQLQSKGVAADMLLDTGGASAIYPEFAFYWKTSDSKIENGFLIFESKQPIHRIRLLSENDEESKLARKVLRDGLLGNDWFAQQIWKIDYLNKKVCIAKNTKNVRGNKISMGFKEGLSYPRISMTVLGEKYDVLLDTGGTSFFSEEAMKKMGIRSAFSASSFIRESVFETWRKQHADWQVIEKGDKMGGNPLIQVPQVEIAGYKVGPVWFARRSNQAYDEMMAQYMDCKCAGAIGGNILRNFQIVLDYPNKYAWFKK